ncbi:rhomboid family intramembrane serine protease [Paenibacillus abyssi]|uniref:Rhomboid family intramembrane serine protease n=1 Tax=Paenibacillus abyssi TaxID=1340531 RepID=A0A917FZM9_9BACL|nr:rhomboid family intramembrane serine protease [Paenibacillus abyssi]GGG15425.1 rhomboid family intramembrane serine protease [Paenibacillus abyssi]
MIFLRYESFRSYLRLYPVTSAILAVNLVLFALLELMGGSTNTLNLIRFGAFIQFPGNPWGLEEPWRYVSSQFLHIGWEHLLFNCFSILVFAPPLEKLLGSAKYAVFYLLCGISGNVFSAFLNTGPGLSAGASGAIYGVFGAYLHLAVLRKYSLDEASRKTVYTILIFGVIYSIIVPGINIWAHIGGAVGGFALFGLFARKDKRRY